MPDSPKVALATSWKHSDLAPDDRLLIEPLAVLGIQSEPRVWDDPRTDWSAFDAVVVRSCWDYHLRATEFLDWLDRLAELEIPVLNPPEAIRWNHDKRYLKDLEERGVPTVPTVWVEPGQQPPWRMLLEEAGWNRVVVKPTISASAHGTHLLEHATSPEAIAVLNRSSQKNSVLVQPYLPEIETGGEWSLMFFGGVYSHAVLKRPAAGDFRTQHEHGGSHVPATPVPSLIQRATEALAVPPWPLLYARVDLVEAQLPASKSRPSETTPLVVELELIEPELYFHTSPQSPSRFGEALRRLTGDGKRA